MTDATTQAVPDTDTTYRVPGSRAVDLKCRALAAYFPPDEVRFLPTGIKNGKALALAYLTARAVEDRLDFVLGPDNWQDEYENLQGGSVRCTLMVRFEPGGEWVKKSDVGSPSEQPDEGDRCKAAHSDALKRAAVKFGVGRYLYSLPNLWHEYDAQKRTFTTRPQLAETVLPTAYRQCGREKARKVIGILESACSEAKVPKDHWRAAADKLVQDYGYKEAKQLVSAENRHADAMIQRLNQWVAEIARNNANCPFSPLYKSPEAIAAETAAREKDIVEKAEKAKAEELAKKKAQEEADARAKTAQNCKPPNLPANGVELLKRLRDYEDKLFKQNLCARGALIAHVTKAGVRTGYVADLAQWTGAVAMNLAVDAVKDFEKTVRAPLPEKEKVGA